MSDLVTRYYTVAAADGLTQEVYFNNLHKYQSVEFVIDWDSLNATDGNIKLEEKHGTSNYVDIPTLSADMDSATDTVALQHRDFGGGDVRVSVDFGTANAGTVYINFIGKTR